jgi:predicted NBD/HSP70 family sugar kinase
VEVGACEHKSHWKDFSLGLELLKSLRIGQKDKEPNLANLFVETDVNAAALAEYYSGKHYDLI